MESDQNQWLEISLTVDGELAEAVADVLARHLSGGVVITSTAVDVKPDDNDGVAVGPLRVSGYLPLDAQREETQQRIEDGLGHLNFIRPLPKPVFRPIHQTNWMEAWKQHYQPIQIGKRLLILPAWMQAPENDERLSIRIDPGMAFGTGAHPTTQLCLQALEENIQGGEQVIDVGCGSGILSVAAIKLGASRALGTDIDPTAIENARQTAQLNHVESNILFGTGSVAEIRAGKFPIQRAPLVMANILAPILIRLLDVGLTNLLAPKGQLILSGILAAEHQEKILQALKSHRLSIQKNYRQADWVAFSTTLQ